MSRIEDNCVFMYLSLSYINNKFTRFFILSALAVHRPFYFSICISTLHTRFILYVARHGSCMTLLNCIQYMWIFDNIPIYSTGKIVFLYCKLFNKEETADEYEDMFMSRCNSIVCWIDGWMWGVLHSGTFSWRCMYLYRRQGAVERQSAVTDYTYFTIRAITQVARVNA